MAKAENLLEVFLNKELIDQRSAGDFVIHDVSHQSPTVFFFERVVVIPQLIRPFELLVDEPKGRLPLGNFRSPADWDAVKLKLVVDQSALLNVDRSVREHSEVQPRRSDFFQLKRVSKERKNVIERSRHPEFRMKPVNAAFCRVTGKHNSVVSDLKVATIAPHANSQPNV